MFEPTDTLSYADAIQVIERRWPRIQRNESTSPVFILSATWRSGSTLLQRMMMQSCYVWGEPYGHAALLDSVAFPLRRITNEWPQDSFVHPEPFSQRLLETFVANLTPGVQSLVDAIGAWFDVLFAQTARLRGAGRWGIKEVRWTGDHAVLLRWLFPKSKIIFLHRNPFDAFRSYYGVRMRGGTWYHTWPKEGITARRFGQHWQNSVRSFLDVAQDVNAFVVSYDDLLNERWSKLEDYLGFSLSRKALQIRPSSGDTPRLDAIPDAEQSLLRTEVEPLASKLGYSDVNGTQANKVASKPSPRQKCVVIVTEYDGTTPENERQLLVLEKMGFAVWRVPKFAAIDYVRNQVATEALSKGFDETMWIDASLVFEPEAVDRLRQHGVPMVCGLYAKKTGGMEWGIAAQLFENTRELQMGKGGGLIEIRYAAAGFLLVQREVYVKLENQLDLPICNLKLGRPAVPYFQPLVNEVRGNLYLSDEFAFSERARQCGVKILAGTSLRIWNVDRNFFGWEDVANSTSKSPSCKLTYPFHTPRPPSRDTND